MKNIFYWLSIMETVGKITTDNKEEKTCVDNIIREAGNALILSNYPYGKDEHGKPVVSIGQQFYVIEKQTASIAPEMLQQIQTENNKIKIAARQILTENQTLKKKIEEMQSSLEKAKKDQEILHAIQSYMQGPFLGNTQPTAPVPSNNQEPITEPMNNAVSEPEKEEDSSLNVSESLPPMETFENIQDTGEATSTNPQEQQEEQAQDENIQTTSEEPEPMGETTTDIVIEAEEKTAVATTEEPEEPEEPETFEEIEEPTELEKSEEIEEHEKFEEIEEPEEQEEQENMVEEEPEEEQSEEVTDNSSSVQVNDNTVLSEVEEPTSDIQEQSPQESMQDSTEMNVENRSNRQNSSDEEDDDYMETMPLHQEMRRSVGPKKNPMEGYKDKIAWDHIAMSNHIIPILDMMGQQVEKYNILITPLSMEESEPDKAKVMAYITDGDNAATGCSTDGEDVILQVNGDSIPLKITGTVHNGHFKGNVSLPENIHNVNIAPFKVSKDNGGDGHIFLQEEGIEFHACPITKAKSANGAVQYFYTATYQDEEYDTIQTTNGIATRTRPLKFRTTYGTYEIRLRWEEDKNAPRDVGEPSAPILRGLITKI